MKKVVAVLLMICLLVIGLAGCNSGKSDWKYIEDKGTLVLGFDDAFPPMGFKDATGKHVGFDLDVAAEVCKILNVELKLMPIVWDNKDMELNTKNIDCIWNGFTVTDERKETISFSKNYLKNEQVVVVKADSTLTFNELANLAVAYQKGSSAKDAIFASDVLKNNTQLLEVSNNVDAMQLELETGSVKAVVMDKIVADYQVKMTTANNNGVAKYKVMENVSLASEQFAVGFRKGDVELTAKVNAALDTLYANGKLVEISNKWFAKDLVSEMFTD